MIRILYILLIVANFCNAPINSQDLQAIKNVVQQALFETPKGFKRMIALDDLNRSNDGRNMLFEEISNIVQKKMILPTESLTPQEIKIGDLTITVATMMEKTHNTLLDKDHKEYLYYVLIKDIECCMRLILTNDHAKDSFNSICGICKAFCAIIFPVETSSETSSTRSGKNYTTHWIFNGEEIDMGRKIPFEAMKKQQELSKTIIECVIKIEDLNQEMDRLKRQITDVNNTLATKLSEKQKTIFVGVKNNLQERLDRLTSQKIEIIQNLETFNASLEDLIKKYES